MKLTPEAHLATIEEGLKQGKSYREIARAIGCGPDSVAKFVRVHLPGMVRTPNSNGDSAPLPQQEIPDELEMLKARHHDLKSQARKARTIDVQAELLLQQARETILPTEKIYEAPEVADGEGNPHAHVLLLSDLHVGEVVDHEAMNGLGAYNWEILQERMQNIYKAVLSFQNNRPYPIDELHIWLLGDMVGGKHHQELGETNEFGVIEQCWRTGMLLGQWMEPLVEAYPQLIVKGISGNHSRVNQKPASKQVFDSFDWLSYKIAELYLSQYETITHSYPLSGNALDTVAGKNVLLIHGDGIRSSMPGVPWGGIMRRFNELRKTYAQTGVLLDYVALGHFHQLNVVRGIFMNGSVKGPDEWVLKQFGTADPPEQMLLTFDKTNRRLTDASFITP